MSRSQVLTLEEEEKKTSGTKRISEAYLYLIMTLPQFKERDTERASIRRPSLGQVCNVNRVQQIK